MEIYTLSSRPIILGKKNPFVENMDGKTSHIFDLWSIDLTIFYHKIPEVFSNTNDLLKGFKNHGGLINR